MKCPKCYYLSFEPEPRCRNCGYDLALVEGAADLDLKAGDSDQEPPVDLALHAPVPSAAPAEPPEGIGANRSSPASPSRLRVVTPPAARPASRAEPAAARAVARPKRARSTTAEMPLFVKNRPEPVEDQPARPATEAGVSDGALRLGPFERDLLRDLQRLAPRGDSSQPTAALPIDDGASAGRRLAAAATDAALLGGISAFVVWATLRLCDLTVEQAATLPLAPLSAFLLLLAGGYLLMFTIAGGQTVGKMLAHIRVVGSADDDSGCCPLTPRQAAIRALLTLPSVLVLGAGFMPAIVGHGPALHDRLSHTRVVDE